MAPGDKAVRLALKSLHIKQKELTAARRNLWGGMFKGGATKSPASGRRQVEEAAARARGDLDAGKGGDRRKDREAGGWGYVLMAAVVGIVAFACAGYAAAKFTQNRP